MPFAAVGAALGVSAGTAALGAATIGGSLIGGVLSSNAAGDATNAQLQASAQANNLQRDIFNQTQSNLKPYMDAGGNSLSALMKALGIGGPAAGTQDWSAYLKGNSDVAAAAQQAMQQNPTQFPTLESYAQWHYQNYGKTEGRQPPQSATGGIDTNAPLVKPFDAQTYQKSPGYDFRMSQGIDAVQNSAAAKGGVFSGNTLKALTTFGQGLANSDYQQGYDNYTGQQKTLFDMLSRLTGIGQSAAAGIGDAGQNYANQAGSNIIGAGNAGAANAYAGANAINNSLNAFRTDSNVQDAFRGMFKDNSNQSMWV